MGEKTEEKGHRVEEWASYILAMASALSPEERIKVLQKAFKMAADKEDDEMASKLMDLIYNVYREEEDEVALKTDRNYGKAFLWAYIKYCDCLRSLYWLLPYVCSATAYRHPFMPQTKLKIIQCWMRQWQRYACDFTDKDEEAVDAFRFLISAYLGEHDSAPKERFVPKEEKEGILKLFRDYTDYRFIPEIAEKWLRQPDIPEEIEKIFIIARARNGGTKLVEREMKNAELLKPFDVENRSEAALEFHKKFCGELAIIDDRFKQFIKELGAGPCSKAEKIKIDEIRLSSRESVYEFVLSIYYKKNDLPYSSVFGVATDIHLFFSKYNIGRYIKIIYILWEENRWLGQYSDTVYLG